MLILFHQDGKKLWINPSFVTSVMTRGANPGTSIWIVAEDGWNNVDESPEEVIAMLNGKPQECGLEEEA